MAKISVVNNKEYVVLEYSNDEIIAGKVISIYENSIECYSQVFGYRPTPKANIIWETALTTTTVDIILLNHKLLQSITFCDEETFGALTFIGLLG